MSEVLYRLDGFEGPLDLLLFLIGKHKLNINDIQISLLLDQYLEYIDGLGDCDFEYAGDFLEMAARLILIKTLSLLPKHEEAEQLRRELQGRLIEYSMCKQAAAKLSESYVGIDIYVRRPTEPEADKVYHGFHEPYDLLLAYGGMNQKRLRSKPVEASVFSPIVSHKIASVATGIIAVLRRLYKTGRCSLKEVLDSKSGKSEKIAVFIAILELTKSGRVKIGEDNSTLTFDPSGRRSLDAT